MDPNAVELEGQIQSDLCLSLLGEVGRRHHVPGQLCRQMHEGADSKEMGQRTAVRAQGCFGTLLQIRGWGTT